MQKKTSFVYKKFNYIKETKFTSFSSGTTSDYNDRGIGKAQLWWVKKIILGISCIKNSVGYKKFRGINKFYTVRNLIIISIVFIKGIDRFMRGLGNI